MRILLLMMIVFLAGCSLNFGGNRHCGCQGDMTEAQKALIDQLYAEDRDMTLSAIRQIATMREKGAFAVPTLTGFLLEEDDVIKITTVHTLGQVGAPAQDALPVLQRMQTEPELASKRDLQAAIRTAVNRIN